MNTFFEKEKPNRDGRALVERAASGLKACYYFLKIADLVNLFDVIFG